MTHKRVNVVFSNPVMPPDTIDGMHPSMSRLLKIAKEATRSWPEPVHDFAGIGRAMEASSATITNWKRRGISKEGAITAAKVFGCSADHVMHGTGPAQGPAAAPRDVQRDTDASGEPQRVEVLAFQVSPRAASIANRLDALSPERRKLAYALMNNTLRTLEAEEELGSNEASSSSRTA